jgi:cytochrome P450
LLTRAAATGSDLVRIRPWWWTLAATPAAAQHVLQTQASNYRKGFFARSFRPVVGDSLLLSEGDTWLRHRRIAQRAFHRQRLAPLLDVIAEATAAMLGRWERVAEAEEPLDVAREMTTLTLAITGQVLFGVDLTDQAAEIGKAAAILMEDTQHRFSHVASLPEWLTDSAEPPLPKSIRRARTIRPGNPHPRNSSRGDARQPGYAPLRGTACRRLGHERCAGSR